MTSSAITKWSDEPQLDSNFSDLMSACGIGLGAIMC